MTRWLSTALVLALAVGSAPTCCTAQGRPSHHASNPTCRVSSGPRMAIDAGSIGASRSPKLLDVAPGNEVAGFGAIWIDAPIRRYLDVVRDIETFERGGGCAARASGSSPSIAAAPTACAASPASSCAGASVARCTRARCRACRRPSSGSSGGSRGGNPGSEVGSRQAEAGFGNVQPNKSEERSTS